MKALVVAVVLGVVAACHPSPTVSKPATEYRGGRWFDGERFVERTMYVVGDRFVEARPAHVTSVVDLHHGYAVPPYGEGHNHWLEPKLVDAYVAANVRDGIFYVRDMSTPFHDQIRGAVNTPGSVDYVAAHQGFTGPGGHPIELVDMLVQMGVLPAEWGPTHGEGKALFVVETEADVDRAWPVLLSTHPDFVKLFLVHSDDYEQRLTSAPVGKKGIDPKLVPGIVRRAHAAHLRVAAHVENAADVHVAIAAGVDDIAHLPFVAADQPETYRIADADLREAAKRDVSFATTFDWASDAGEAQLAVARDNLAALARHGNRVVIGTDQFRQTASVEVDLVAKLRLMSNLELLRAWAVTTPQAIFPARKLGRLAAGYEASFLVLRGDPLVDPAQLHAIVMRVKQGREIQPGAAKLPALGP